MSGKPASAGLCPGIYSKIIICFLVRSSWWVWNETGKSRSELKQKKVMHISRWLWKVLTDITII